MTWFHIVALLINAAFIVTTLMRLGNQERRLRMIEGALLAWEKPKGHYQRGVISEAEVRAIIRARNQ